MAIAVKHTNKDGLDPFLKLCVVGEAGAGKPELAATFPDPIFATTHEGIPSLAARDIPFVEIDTSKALLDFKAVLSQNDEVKATNLGGLKPKTLVIDTVDGVQRLFAHERLLATRKESMDGADYGWLGDQMEVLLAGLRNLDMHVVFLVNQKEVQVNEQTVFKPMLVGRTVDQIFENVDYAMHMTARGRLVVEGNQAVSRVIRILQCAPDDAHPWIRDDSHNLPPEFVVNFEDDYIRLQSTILGTDAVLLEKQQRESEQRDKVAILATREDRENLRDAVGSSPHSTSASMAVSDEPKARKPEKGDDEALQSSELVEVAIPQPVDEAGDRTVDSPATGVVAEDTPEAAGQTASDERSATDVAVDLLTKEFQATPVSIEGKYACKDCGVLFDDVDEADKGILKFRVTVCTSCYDDRVKKSQ